MLAFYKELLRVRAAHVVPMLRGTTGNQSTVRSDKNPIAVDWSFPGGSNLHLLANLSDASVDAEVEQTGEPIFWLGSMDGQTLAPWSVIWSKSSGQ
jgi:1,4-alpha-glucan branching enzyme